MEKKYRIAYWTGIFFTLAFTLAAISVVYASLTYPVQVHLGVSICFIPPAFIIVPLLALAFLAMAYLASGAPMEIAFNENGVTLRRILRRTGITIPYSEIESVSAHVFRRGIIWVGRPSPGFRAPLFVIDTRGGRTVSFGNARFCRKTDMEILDEFRKRIGKEKVHDNLGRLAGPLGWAEERAQKKRKQI